MSTQMSNDPVSTPITVSQQTIQGKTKSRATTFHPNHGLPLKIELAERYPNMPRRERRRLARLLAEAEAKSK